MDGVIAVPGDGAASLRRRQRVEVAIAVDVGGEDGDGAGDVGGDGVRRPGGAVAGGVLVPGDLVVVEGGGEDVEIAVAVDVGDHHRARAVGACGDGMYGPRRAIAGGVLVPG